MEQPCALTTKVSQTSEKWVAGSRLVTRIGTLAGTLELRRAVAEVLEFCIVYSPSREGVAAGLLPPSDVAPTLTLSAFAGLNREY